MMHRLLPTLLLLAALPAFAQDSKPPQLTLEEQTLAAEATTLINEGMRLYQRGRPTEAVDKFRQSLKIRQQLFPRSKYPDGHPDLATSFTAMGFVLQSVGQ